MMHICLFDIDGTLLSSGGAGKTALERGLAEEYGIEGVIDRMKLSGRSDRAIVRDLLRQCELPDEPEHWARVREAYLRHLPQCLRESSGKVLPGIEALLKILRPRDDVAVGLLTGNVRAGAKIKLGHFGLYEHFAFGGFGDHHDDRDDIAREALEETRRFVKHQVDPSRIWVVGDTPYDVRCARAIGAKAVGVLTGWHTHEEMVACKPDLLVRDLADPSVLLELWA